MLNVDFLLLANLEAQRNPIPSLTNFPSSVKTKRVFISLVLYISIRSWLLLGISERAFCFFKIGRSEFVADGVEYLFMDYGGIGTRTNCMCINK